MFAGGRINDLQPWVGAPSAITLAHGQPVFALVRSTRSPFSWPWETCIGESRAAATAQRSKTSTSKATARFVRQTVLGYCQQFWSTWKQALIVVTPETVVRWHRAGFRFYWRLISRVRRPAGRRRISKEVRDLIYRMVAENPSWGAPRIHGELLMLGLDLSERTVSRWMKRAPRDPQATRRWLVFLRNHRETIAAMDFFTVPTITNGGRDLQPVFRIVVEDQKPGSRLDL
jgi:hypothetical protein